ncbi:MAG: peptide deformylase [candidate division WOR-3 bacterium]|jgi:peptide deformylase
MSDILTELADIGRARRIVLYGNPILRTAAARIREITPEVLQLAADLKATLAVSEGIGLAANQIGTAWSAFVLVPREADVDLPLTFIINPEIVATEGTVEDEEGCLSIPGIFEVVNRPEMVIIRGIDLTGREIRLETAGLLARAVMHEYEHLQGKLFIDHLSELRRQLLRPRLMEIEQREKQQCG